MLKPRILWVKVVCLGLLLLLSRGVKAEEMHAQKATKFKQIEQPLQVKTAVTLGGIALIGAELWWFVLSKQKQQQKK